MKAIARFGLVFSNHLPRSVIELVDFMVSKNKKHTSSKLLGRRSFLASQDVAGRSMAESHCRLRVSVSYLEKTARDSGSDVRARRKMLDDLSFTTPERWGLTLSPRWPKC